MLFTGWEIPKAPADSVSTGQLYFFLEGKHGRTVNSSCSLTGPAKCPCSLPHGRALTGLPSHGAASEPSPQMSTHADSPKPQRDLEIAASLRKEPTTFQKASTTPSLPSAHVTGMVKMRVDGCPALFSLGSSLKCPSPASSSLPKA